MPISEADKLLIKQIRDGDQDAWGEFIGRYEGRLLAFVDSRLRNRATSEDVVQEAFMGFLISLPNYDDRTPIESFLFAIAAHKLTDLLRREGRRPTIPLFAQNSDGQGPEPADKARAASSMMRSREGKHAESAVLGECLEGLIEGWVKAGEFERLECIELLFVLDWPNKKVAKRLDISEQAVANHKHFVVAKLKDAAKKSHLRSVDFESLGLDS